MRITDISDISTAICAAAADGLEVEAEIRRKAPTKAK